MAFAILLYNTVLTSVLTLSMACAYYLHSRERRRIFAVLGSGEKNLLGPLAPEITRPRTCMDLFSQNYGLTEREREILEQLLVGKSQQELCEELVIAIGTVKTHIHNIYHKTEGTKRGQLMAKYQDFSEVFGGETVAEAEETV